MKTDTVATQRLRAAVLVILKYSAAFTSLALAVAFGVDRAALGIVNSLLRLLPLIFFVS